MANLDMTTQQSYPQLPGYTLTELIYPGTRTHVYRGVHQQSQQPVVIKMMKRDYPTFGELAQFRNQYVITKNIDIPGIVKTLSLEAFGNGYAIVMEDSGSISVSQYLENQDLSLLEIFEISLQLTTILHKLHRQRIIYQDIKPTNILIHPNSGQITLSDFSIASLLPKETQAIQSPQGLEGTLAYLAPEQTGRMNRGIDHRTDFYALGVTLYELLTGQLPFCSDDPLEMIHSHIAKTPTPVHEVKPEIPLMLGTVVAKLMAKNAEDRYQSALGLQHDLRKCLNQWQARGEITEFALGQRDLSDRFLIPEKLYGRETEVAQLLTAFDRVAEGTSELLLVAGFSGIGKTAVINEVHKPIVRQRGYFIKGKFDQFNRNIPLNAFVQVFSDLVGQLLSESDQQLQIWKTKILAALAESAQVMIDLIPELERIIGPQPPATELSGEAAQNRFNRLFRNFIQVFTTADHPLVIFIDDLQWADSASLNLLEGLLTEAQSEYLLVLGAYRDNEVFPEHPFLMTVQALENADVTLETLTLGPLSPESLNHLIADAFRASEHIVQPLTNLVMQKTQGNPFFATQFLKALHQDGLITFDHEARHWQCDLVQVQDAALTDDVVEFMALQLQKLPMATQEQLKFAACIGAKFNLKTLAIVSEQDPLQVSSALWPALQEGLIVPESKIYKFYLKDDQSHAHLAMGEDISEQINYRFFHDQVQQAAYSLIPEDRKQVTHLKIGQLLQAGLSAAEREEKLFDIVSHLNLGRELLSEQAERESLIRLNLTAIEKAKKATAYVAAGDLVTVGLELLSSQSWQAQYELTLSLHQMAAEVACLAGDFEEASYRIQQVLEQAQTVLDQAPAYMVQIRVLSAQNKLLEAIAIAAHAITELGIAFPSDITPSLTEQALQDVAMELEGNVIEDLVNLPMMTDPTRIAAMKLLGMIIPMVFMSKPAFLPFVCAKIVSLSLQFGNASVSSAGYVSYGMVLTTGLGQVEQGYRLGKIALALIDQLNSQEYKPLTILFFSSFVQYRKEPMASMAALEKQGYLAGIEMGDFLYAGYCLSAYFTASLFTGNELPDLQAEFTQSCQVIASLKQDHVLTYLQMSQEFLRHLVEITDEPTLLISDAYDETKIFPQYLQNNELVGLAAAYTYKLILAYLFGDYHHALDYLNEISRYLDTISGMLHLVAVQFYGGLTYLAMATATSEDERLNLLDLAQQHRVSLSVWAEDAPMNYQHKVDLLAAEMDRVLGNIPKAIDGYERAIAGAKANGFIQEEALAHELAAQFYLGWGKEKVAAGYMQDAYYCYTRWGAKAKVADLEQRYPQLLQPILQSANQPLTLLETLATIAAPAYPIHATSSKSASSGNSINQTLDFVALLQVSQTFASTIALDELLQTLTQTMLENSGADRCALILCEENQWQVRVSANLEQVTLQSAPLDNNANVPVKLIQYVKNTATTVVIDDLKTDLPVMDDYLYRHQPKSALCLPILKQGNVRAILYLENRFTSSIFTGDRILILNFLCTQAAISLENASLYQKVSNYSHTLEAEVMRQTQAIHQKNQELEQILKDLRQTQAQLIQAEKMSSLGQLVAGIAHEINNPISFIKGNIAPLANYLEDFKDLLDLYLEDGNQVNEDVRMRQEELDLDFMLQDIEKIMESMIYGSDRIHQIVLSLRNFSRLDESLSKAVDLHSGIDSTLLILRHRLQKIGNSPEIQVICDYGQLPLITCYPSQLNQVFLNIINNAIDAIRENPECSDKPEIRIRTETLDQERVCIAIANTDSQIPEEIQGRIFDPFFTTKPVGSGTGLGLFVSYSIIQKHGGTLKLTSPSSGGTEFVISLPQTSHIS